MSAETPKFIGKKITISGWAETIRKHKNIIFIDLRDRDGLTQIIIENVNKKSFEVAQSASIEDVLKIEGWVVSRPKGLENKNLASGKIELHCEKIEVLSKSKDLPFEIEQKAKKINEETRLKYRYLDLRSNRMKNNLKNRHLVNQFVRNYLTEQGFWEIETPFLTKSTPEGARDFIVPSRLHKGKFYALPQSPQQYKQLLMVAGIEKYFQIVRCMRDEDQRGDRQPEFTQIDLEMSFIEQKDILSTVEKMIIELVKKNYPNLKIKKIPFEKLTYNEAMAKYKTERPDLRKNKQDKNEMAFAWIVDFPAFEWKEKENRWDAVHHPFTMINPQDINQLEQKDKSKIRALQYDLVLNGFEIGGGSMRIHKPELLSKIFEILGHKPEDIQRKFSHLLEAFSFGVPPHGGLAIGYDRLMMILQQEDNIREVIAFPKTGDGQDPMMVSPSVIDQEQLDELNLKIKS
ncbi:MAG: aspartyl-tRNA synthetase [Candidatus Berkelbacteria bacterium Licking1014_7]|uniref:Aspartate--tRNA(Asp/Asn) ligase n=1 Tax=Candidatus Berkelbacteria bacterium Licking1014_7 TaxID=2017147 RepID=A0A554LHZ6_9BACT|nr:MAG: aspartyl-tRNA synthetase [Candidatus Berkelbacteria bacterium Licking1014_7]